MHFSEAEQTRLELRANDLLVCEGGSIGRTALWNNEVDGCVYPFKMGQFASLLKGDLIEKTFLFLGFSFTERLSPEELQGNWQQFDNGHAIEE